MDLKKAMLERRLRSALKDADGRRLLDAWASDEKLVQGFLQDTGAAAGPALADAVRRARTEGEARFAISWAGYCGESSALDAVRRAVGEGTQAARIEALSALLTHGGPEDGPRIAACLADPDEGARDAVYAYLSEIERMGMGDPLPPAVGEALATERRRRAEASAAALRVEMEGPYTTRSAGKLLVTLCNEIDTTFEAPVTPQMESRRASLREDVARVGRGLYEQGGEDLMVDVANLVASASSHGQYVSREWTGIGGWLG